MATNVAELCKQKQLTVEHLAEQSGLDPSRVTAVVMGRWTPSPAERKAIAAVFAISVDEIAWGHVTPIQHIYGHGPG